MQIKNNIIYHALFWLVLIISIAVSNWTYSNTFFNIMIFEIIFLPIRMVAVYLNWYVFIPELLYKNKFKIYVIILILSLVGLGMIQRIFVIFIAYPLFFPQWLTGENIFNISIFLKYSSIIITPLIFTTGWKLYNDLKQEHELVKAIEKQKKDTEIKHIKSQINPDFLFNTLNTIYGLSMENSKKTSELILKLSNFLSFSLYESNQKLIPIEKEIALMNDFITLENSRFDDRIETSIDLPKSNTVPVAIPPLILVPFVENAFKHCLKNETKMAQINIQLSVNTDLISFKVKHSKLIDSSITSNTNKELCLTNIKKRLDIIYGEKYALNINDSEASYLIELNIDLT